MIVIEGSWWPLVVVGEVDGDVLAPSSETSVDERCLALSDELYLAIIIAGQGDQSLRAQRSVLRWLCRLRRILTPRVRRIAWVIEDDMSRACTDAWLHLTAVPTLAAPSETFRTVSAALTWLLESAPVGDTVPLDSLLDARYSF